MRACLCFLFVSAWCSQVDSPASSLHATFSYLSCQKLGQISFDCPFSFPYIGNYSFIGYVVFLQSLAEKGGSDLQKITAHPNFFLLATMNPGGDFGKKESSPALCNRFTERWVPPIIELDELNSIALERFVNAKFLFSINS